MKLHRVAILVGGGPAPGINAVIGAATIEAVNRGMSVVGITDGFRWLSAREFDPHQHTLGLNIQSVGRIHFEGGSILRTSRANLLDPKTTKGENAAAPSAEKVERVLYNLRLMAVDGLITIGGDDTALSARFVSEASKGEIRVVHVPKTIDNDLPLPQDVPTFGFSTARYVGTLLIKNLMRDSQTTGRWYICQTMGRTAGWLALSVGMAAGATLTVIPEEFPERTTFSHLADILEGAILKRRVLGRPDGVAIIAEGLAYRLGDKAELERMLGREVPLDAAGHPRLSEVDLSRLLKDEIVARFKKRGQDVTLVDHEVGYEMRSADPTPYDMGYCRSLGYFAVQLLLDERYEHVMVNITNGNLQPIALQDMIDPATNRTRTRTVDVRSDSYRVARAYMIRLERSDFDSAAMLGRLAEEARMTPEEFRARFERVARGPDGEACAGGK